jgi:hypothetical protein
VVHHIFAVRTLIARAALDVWFAGPDFVDGKVVPTLWKQPRQQVIWIAFASKVLMLFV